MTVRSVPIFLQAGSHPAEETRLMLGGMLRASTGSFAGGAASSDPAHGVVRSTDLAVSQNGTPNMSVNVATGGCFIRGTQNANQGAYHLWNDGTVNLAISAADATNPRRDLIIAQVRDAAYSGASNDARILVVTGTPAASPSDPSLTSYPNALVLARVAVAAGATSIVTANITDLRTVANVHGQVPEFATTAARSIAIPSPYNGQLSAITSADTNHGVEQYNGTSWRKPWSMPWGNQLYATNSTSNSTFTTTATVISGMTGSVSLVNNRVYQCTFTCRFYNSSANNHSLFRIRQGGNIIFDSIAYNYSTGNDITHSVVCYFRATSTGSVTFDVQGYSGTGTLTVFHSNGPTVFTVNDVGPYGAPV